jgi:crotonobetainyl-CoA:carnitine CoA-transferase CaiB-like acyl-CoA transferase
MPPPLLGQHTEEVLADLGYSVAEMSALRERKAI